MKILYFIYGLNIGGAETYIYNTISRLNNSKYHIDFVLQNKKNDNHNLINLCKKNNSKLYYVSPFTKWFFPQLFQLNKILKNNEYQIIHIHMNSMLNIIPIIMGRLNGLKIIIHSHSTQNNSGRIVGKAIHLFNRKMILNFIKTVNIACSEKAGIWMFDKRPFILIDNAVQIDQFIYSKDAKIKLKEKNMIYEEKVIGHIGRYVDVKNHFFIIKVFNEYIKIHPNTKLVLIGEGELKEQVNEYISYLGIEKNIIELNNQSNINEYYSLFDCFLFPSKFEGFPFVLVEAQIAGLPIIASTNVTKSVDLFGKIEFVSLENDISDWVSKIDKCLNQNINRNENNKELMESKYNIDNSVKKIEKIYMGEDYEDLYYHM
ncbi:glycosyltransferase [Candidatus Stoquefichus sp. SB1]|uniref:glycosyltransferase n=1 Tax=Candidatus Stoquefichus sp. SB1 TaxID=1658109 RepID=UPI00067EC289|nr:glycosyltransferase [Candidatus Stoquefichus sp. SB1]